LIAAATVEIYRLALRPLYQFAREDSDWVSQFIAKMKNTGEFRYEELLYI
jgi:hypothetical protein